ncbi:hypothetical protein [Colwellia psychrerythraea]|uniref:Uncharacterized protein n=1 Tax=Colwellia psychrerythraea TaxID=28229 RepID=A0A099KDH7_COLPS|nr:hypothetical protein [Colwellia psychrerythraea]KGJ88804.1 hypothetical protein ND2E_0097 [Colwellia psychrerythraea]
MSYINNLAMASTRLLNTLLGGRANQSLSARAYVNSQHSKRWDIARNSIDKLFYKQTDHCKKAVTWDAQFNKRSD